MLRLKLFSEWRNRRQLTQLARKIESLEARRDNVKGDELMARKTRLLVWHLLDIEIAALKHKQQELLQ